MSHKVACIQMNSINDMDSNIESALMLMDQAVAKGAKLITLPENACFMAENGAELDQHAHEESDHPALLHFAEFAQAHACWVLIGSLAVPSATSGKLANRSFMINESGKIVATYDKIHLYDADVTGGESHKESNRYHAGKEATLVKTPIGMLGLTICYDLRFPHLYRSLAQAGAQILTVPSAFTKFTGAAHWHTLLKARAIETGCFVIAPAQTGTHPAKRETYGHSLIINPWGDIIAEADEDPGYIISEIDVNDCDTTRKQLSSLLCNPEFTIKTY